MTDVFEAAESGEKCRFQVAGLPYAVALPYVVLERGNQRIRIGSLNLIGQIRLNRDLGALLAQRIRATFADLQGVVLLTVVEKALQLTQVVAQHLGIDAVAVAYNRIKPHMESRSRPTVQVGADSITSGGKFLALYERDINLLLGASRGIIVIDDVVSSGGTLLAVAELIEKVGRLNSPPAPLPILGVFCVAQEGKTPPSLPALVTRLALLPDPEVLDP